MNLLDWHRAARACDVAITRVCIAEPPFTRCHTIVLAGGGILVDRDGEVEVWRERGRRRLCVILSETPVAPERLLQAALAALAGES